MDFFYFRFFRVRVQTLNPTLLSFFINYKIINYKKIPMQKKKPLKLIIVVLTFQYDTMTVAVSS